jgi:hypothetical protein
MSVTPYKELHEKRKYSESERFNLLREVAELYDPKVWPWAYDTWRALNNKYFIRGLKVGPIAWGLTDFGHSLGHYTPQVNKITLHSSLLEPSSGAWGYGGLLGERMAEDVLLHEMLHQSIQQKLGFIRDKKGQCHNFQPWCDEINRLNPIIGLEGKATIIKQRRVREPGQATGKGRVVWAPSNDGTLTRKQLSTWPYSLRPAGYYEESCLEMLARMTAE